ncbi:MAG: phosphate ABC transporter substrate-binding protein, partial [Verrucomicrobiota bacterium]
MKYSVPIILSTLATAGASLGQIRVDPSLKKYEKAEAVSGELSTVGSDTLNTLMTLWAEHFHRMYPEVKIQIEGKGSSTAPPALVSGISQLGPMSRRMKPEERDAFEAKHGFKPTAIGVALDSLAVYVNKDNPIRNLSLQQVDAVYSVARNGGHPEAITTWGQLGLTGAWRSRPIGIYGRNALSGTYGYFKKHALFKGDFNPKVQEQVGSAEVVNKVTLDLGGIGYSGIGYRTSGVRAVPLSKKTGGTILEPTYQNVVMGSYPLSRVLYVYVAKEPGKPLPPIQREFLKLVLSKDGQDIVLKDGYLPLP